MTQKSQMDSKNSTSTTTRKLIFMLAKSPHTWGNKREREVALFKYSPEESCFMPTNVYGRIRDCFRGMHRMAAKLGADFRIVYLKVE